MKLLKTSNFTFYHNVFYAIFISKVFNSHVSDVVLFEFGKVSKWYIREWVKSTNQQNLRLLQTESVCTLPIKFGKNNNIRIGKGGKHCEKRRKGWLPVNSFLGNVV